jgi:hypothetical protein
MSRTGSTSEQKSPTEWRLRLGLALVVGVLLLMATSASAGWGTRTVPGSPNDVRIWAPGTFSVATDAGAWLERADRSTEFISTPDKAEGSFYNPSRGCFLAFHRGDGGVQGNASCLGNTSLPASTSIIRVRVRTTEAGAGFLLLHERGGANPVRLYRADSPGESQWVDIVTLDDSQLRASNALGVLRMDNAEDVVFGAKDTFGGALYWYRGSAQLASYFFDGPVNAPVVSDSEVVDLFPAAGNTPAALFSWGNSLYRVMLGDPEEELPYPGGEGSITALDVNTGAGTQHGDGFGMATVQRDGGVTLLSAVPAAQPQDIGSEWRVNPTLPTGLTAPRALECYGSNFCVIAHGAATTDNVFVYTNDAPPTLTVGSPNPIILPSGTSRTINVSAADADGDAVLVKVVPSSISESALSMTTTSVAGGVDLLLNAGTVCSNVLKTINVSATDGLDSHNTGGTYNILIQRALAPTAPTIHPRPNIAVPAGGLPQTLSADAGAACGIHEFRWTELFPDAGLLVVSGTQKNQATFTPPKTACHPLGEIHAYRVVAVEDGGVSSPPTDVTIQVLPWGAPNAPFFDGGIRTVNIQAGDSEVLTPDMPSHECDRPGSPFPGVETVWQLVDGGSLPPDVRLKTPDGRLVGSSAITPTLTIETDRCADARFDLTVQHYTDGGFGGGGPESRVQVTVSRNGNQGSERTLELSTGEPVAGGAAGSANVREDRCPRDPAASGLEARISLTRAGTIAYETQVPVPGPWKFVFDDVCEGTTFGLRGELLLDGGVISTVEGNDVTVLSVQQPRLQPMADPYLTARCGEPATGVLEQRPLPPCSGLDISWTRVGGVELMEPTFLGQRFVVTTKRTDFAGLIGQSVVMEMSAETLGKATVIQEIPILSEPFVELHRRTEKTTGTDVDLIGVSVELLNTTECGVSNVAHLERLEGVDYVPGSMRFNGSPVEPEVEGDTLRVRELVLEGSTSGQLTYVVRPRLLEKSRFEGQTFVNGVSVSQPLEEPPSGCGCSGAGSGLAAIGLAGLAMALRRRRER